RALRLRILATQAVDWCLCVSSLTRLTGLASARGSRESRRVKRPQAWMGALLALSACRAGTEEVDVPPGVDWIAVLVEGAAEPHLFRSGALQGTDQAIQIDRRADER